MRQKLSTEQKDRQRIEDVYMKKDDQIGRLRSSFDRSLNAITGDTRNLKSILDKSLHKLDKHIMSSQGLATDSEVTSTEDGYEINKSRQSRPADYIAIPTKLDKYRPAKEEKPSNALLRRSSPTRKTSPDRKQSPNRKTKKSSERSRYDYAKFTSPVVSRENPLKVSSSKRNGRL